MLLQKEFVIAVWRGPKYTSAHTETLRNWYNFWWYIMIMKTLSVYLRLNISCVVFYKNTFENLNTIDRVWNWNWYSKWSFYLKYFLFFFYLDFLSQILTIHRTAGESYFFYSALPLPPFHWHLDISRAITAESSSLQIASNRIRTGNLFILSASR